MRRDHTAKRDKALGRAALLLQRGDLGRAAAVLEDARAELPDDDRILVKLAEIRRTQGRAADAVEIYLEAAAQHGRRGFALRAVALLKQARRLDPGNPRVLEPLAARQRELGQEREAVDCLVELADATERLGDRQRFQAALATAAMLSPTDPALPIRLATHLAATGQASQAEEVLTQAAAAFEAAGDGTAWLAVMEQRANVRAPDRADRLRLARAHLGRGNARPALRHLQPLLTEGPRDAELLDLVASAFEALGLHDRAVLARREREQLSRPPPLPRPPPPAPPLDPAAEHLRKAEILVRYQERERALEHLALAAAEAPSDPEPVLRQRDLLLDLGRPVEAARAALTALERLLAAGRPEEAAAAVASLRAISFPVQPDGAGRAAAVEPEAPAESVEVPIEQTTTAEPLPEGLEDDLQQAEFLAAHGHLEEARALLAGALAARPGHAAITARLAELTARITQGAEPGSAEDLGLTAALLEEAEELVSLDEEAAAATEPPPLRAVIARAVRPEDAATHLDLGVAFYEMGLHEQAVEELELARLADPSLLAAALALTGRCRLALGDAEGAVEALEGLIARPDLAPEARAEASFHLAEAHAAAGRPRHALLHAREACRLAPTLPGAAGLLEALEQAGRPAAPPSGEPAAWEDEERTPSAA